MTMKIVKYLVALLTIFSCMTVQAFDFNNVTLDTLPHFHRQNLPVNPEDTLLAASCQELDEAITYLIPDTYQYKPNFYDDKYNGAAIWASSLDSAIGEVAWLYLPYSWFISYLEEGRQHEAFYKIEKLRMAKAIKECYVQ